MKLHYMGKYDLNPESIPTKPHKPNHVKFKEPEDVNKLSIITSIISFIIVLIFLIPIYIKGFKSTDLYIGVILVIVALFPHEILHAICFKDDVYLYTCFRRGMLFVTGPEDMSKARFIFLSLLPNIILGFIPYLIYLFIPNLTILGIFGAMNVSAGSGDYLNVFNAITQMPKGSRTYIHQFSSYWYIPQE